MNEDLRMPPCVDMEKVSKALCMYELQEECVVVTSERHKQTTIMNILTAVDNLLVNGDALYISYSILIGSNIIPTIEEYTQKLGLFTSIKKWEEGADYEHLVISREEIHDSFHGSPYFRIVGCNQ